MFCSSNTAFHVPTKTRSAIFRAIFTSIPYMGVVYILQCHLQSNKKRHHESSKLRSTTLPFCPTDARST